MNLSSLGTLLCFLLLFSQMSHAKLQSINIQKDLPKSTIDLYDPKLLVHKKNLDSLSKMKFHEIHLQWSDCSNLGESLVQKHKDLEGWIVRTWLHCLAEEQKTTANTVKLRKALGHLEKNWDRLSQGEWATDIHDYFFSLKMSFVDKELGAKKEKAALAMAESLVNEKFAFSFSQNAQLWEVLGDLYKGSNKNNEALFAWKKSQGYKSSASVESKVRSLLEIEKVEDPAVEAPIGRPIKDFVDRIEASLKNNEPLTAIKDIVELMNHFPSSVEAKQYSGRVISLYSGLNGLAAKKAQGELEKAHLFYVLDWAESLHKRADYEAALSLAQSVMKKLEGSQELVKALWIAGRSAHFLGNYPLAITHYQTLIVDHVGTSEAQEAHLRIGLVFIRLQDFESAVNFLDKLVALKPHRYDLSAKYWLARSLQKTKSPRAQAVVDEIIEKYPFTYYGLKLAAEANGGKAEFRSTKEKLPTLDSDFFISADLKKNWERFKKLSRYGWVGEAQAELIKLQLPDEPRKMLAWAKAFSDHQQYVTAIRLTNAAMENSPELRREEFLKPGFPLAFVNMFKSEGERYQLDAVLLQSLTRQESAFNLSAISRANAMGLMQMIPGTAREVAQKMGLKISIPDDMYRPEVNIPMGTFYINQMIEQFSGHVPFALAAYNAGPTRFRTWIRSRTEVQSLMQVGSNDPFSEIWMDEVPWRETSFYVKSILRNSIIYKLIASGSFELKPEFWQDMVRKKK